MQVSYQHLRYVHGITTKQYRAMGYLLYSPARLEQLRAGGIAQSHLLPHRTGDKHPNYKGGHVTRAGYRAIHVNGKRLMEHRVVAEQILGRPLRSDEHVHHKDGNKANNSLDNLQVMSASEHAQLTHPNQAVQFTTQDTIDAAVVLHQFGWPNAKIERALRVDHYALLRWLSLPLDTNSVKDES